MAYVPIPKDLSKIKSKVAFNLTKRQLIGFGLSGVVGLPSYWMLKNTVPNEVALMIMMGLIFPILYATFFEKDGLVFEKYYFYMYLNRKYHWKLRRKRGFKGRIGGINGSKTKGYTNAKAAKKTRKK